MICGGVGLILGVIFSRLIMSFYLIRNTTIKFTCGSIMYYILISIVAPWSIKHIEILSLYIIIGDAESDLYESRKNTINYENCEKEFSEINKSSDDLMIPAIEYTTRLSE